MRKFTAMTLGVLILCLAPVVNAANEHPAKAEHFSMLELKRKLSTLILEKYPNAHIDSDVFSINACNSQQTKDASNDNHSCSDPQMKPRPDSANFTLQLSVGVDLTETQRMLFMPERHIVSKATVGKRYDFKLIPEFAHKEYPKVPDDSWAFFAYNKLVRAGAAEPLMRRFSLSLLPVSRLEFAVAIARLLDKKSERIKDTPVVKEIIAELAVEFAPELAYLSMRGGGLDSKDERASKPRYEFLQFQFQSGSQFDKKLQEQIENTIADYAATWLKSNSSTDAAAAQK